MRCSMTRSRARACVILDCQTRTSATFCARRPGTQRWSGKPGRAGAPAGSLCHGFPARPLSTVRSCASAESAACWLSEKYLSVGGCQALSTSINSMGTTEAHPWHPCKRASQPGRPGQRQSYLEHWFSCGTCLLMRVPRQAGAGLLVLQSIGSFILVSPHS